MHCPRYRISPSQNCAQMYHEHKQILPQRLDLHYKSSNLVVEMHHRWLILSGVCIFSEGVLVGVVIIDGRLVVPGRDNIDVVVRRHALGGDYLLPLQQVEGGFWVAIADGLEVLFFAEVELVDGVGGVEGADFALHLHLHVVVEVGVAADVEIPRHLLHREGTDQSASIFVQQGLSNCLELSGWILFMQQFIVPSVNIVAIFIEPPLLHRANVGRMRHHDVLQIKRDQLAGECVEGDIEVDAAQASNYVISYRVKSLSMLISAAYSGERQLRSSMKVKVRMRKRVSREMQPPRLVGWAKSEGTFLKMSKWRRRFSNDINTTIAWICHNRAAQGMRKGKLTRRLDGWIGWRLWVLIWISNFLGEFESI